MDRSGGDGEGAGLKPGRQACYHGRTDRGDESPCGRHQYRSGESPGKGSSPRCHEPCVCIWPAVPQGGGHYPSGGHFLLRGGQYGHHRDDRGPEAFEEEAGECHCGARTVR